MQLVRGTGPRRHPPLFSLAYHGLRRGVSTARLLTRPRKRRRLVELALVDVVAFASSSNRPIPFTSRPTPTSQAWPGLRSLPVATLSPAHSSFVICHSFWPPSPLDTAHCLPTRVGHCHFGANFRSVQSASDDTFPSSSPSTIHDTAPLVGRLALVESHAASLTSSMIAV